MKKLTLALCLALASISAFAQTIVTAEKTNEDVELCFHKQVQIKGYAFANIVGKCAWDPAMNGMVLTLVAVSEDPTAEADKIDLGYIRNVTVVQNKNAQAQISIVQDDMDEEGNVIQKKRVIYVRSVDAKKGTFSVVTK